MTRLARFIRDNSEEILAEWENFARALPMGADMDIAALRDHAKEMLDVIVADLDRPQTREEQHDKSLGRRDAADGSDALLTAAQQHGAGRAGSGFSVAHMVSEFRALRASVLALWRKQHDVTAADMDDVMRFNEAIDQAIAESIARYARDIAQSKDRFLAILAHDLRDPLGAVMTSSDFVLQTAGLKEPYLSLVRAIATSSRRMNRMVLDLLDFTRTRFGDSIPILRGDMDARKMIHNVVAEMSATYPDSVMQVETSGDLRGHWDSERLTQAVVNLIGNAVQHGSNKSPIRVVARAQAAEIEIAVHNEGPGIPPAKLTTLFQSMKSVSGDGASDRHHLGLGLYIVDQIAKAHGGRIEVQSTSELGTTFTIHLPR